MANRDTPQQRPSRRERIGLVGCVKSKRDSSAPAKDLYTSPLFLGRRRWVAQTCDRWFILSAKHGLVGPEGILKPYNETLTDKSRSGRREWAKEVVAALTAQLGDLGTYDFEIHAGAAYSEFGLRDALDRAGAEVECPAAHLGQGEQLRLYRRGPAPGNATSPAAIANRSLPLKRRPVSTVALVDPSYRAADMHDAIEQFLNPERLTTRDDVLAKPCPVPSMPGVYGWWFRSAPAAIDTHGCVTKDACTLLYVGISPKRPPANGKPPSNENLRKRIRYHYTGNAEGSTLRKTLGCLLADELGIELRRVGSGTRMTFALGEQTLSAWMADNALVSWVPCDAPWEVEERLIADLDLPMNLDGNVHNPFHKRLRDVRANAVMRAKSLPVVPNPGVGGS